MCFELIFLHWPLRERSMWRNVSGHLPTCLLMKHTGSLLSSAIRLRVSDFQTELEETLAIECHPKVTLEWQG